MRIQIWRTVDGRRLMLSQMHDSHLANAIAMIKRGHDAKGRCITARTASLLTALEVEQTIRDIRKYDSALWC